jgi:hypothetical protein
MLRSRPLKRRVLSSAGRASPLQGNSRVEIPLQYSPVLQPLTDFANAPVVLLRDFRGR